MEHDYKKIIEFLKKYQEKTDVKGYVIGISGGKDSTIVTKLLCDAIGNENVLGVLMPNGIQKDIDDAYDVVNYFDIDYHCINVANTYYNIVDNIETEEFVITLTEASKINIVPRIRMIILYAIAQSKGYRVVGTSNASEQFIGWCTKWGDMACDVNPISHLTCTQVIALGEYLRLPYEMVHKIPADGLTNKSDEEMFGFSYAALDEFIRNDQDYNNSPIANRILEKHLSSRHKFQPITIKNYGKTT